MDTVLYLVCDSSTGEFIGFYNDNEVVDSLMSSRDNLIALGVYSQLRDELLTRNFKVNISSLPSSDITIDSMEYITFTLDVEPDDIRLANIKAAICNEIDIIAEDSIKNGTIVDIKGEHYKPKFHHVYTIPFFHIMLNFFYFTSSIYTIKSRLRQGVRGDGRGSKPV